MSDFRRHGELVGYWGTLDATGAPVVAATGTGFSAKVFIGEAVHSYGYLVNVSGACTVTLYAAHSSQVTVDGDEPDHSTPPGDTLFLPYFYNGTAIATTFAGAGSAYVQVPNFVAGWTALKASVGVNAWAGYEAIVI